MAHKQKLELTWIGKDDEVRLEPRVLVEDPELSYGDEDTENMIIYGDNLLALKALEQNYAGKVKCIYIDTPYNTGARTNADGDEVGYEDGIEHSERLSLMKPRLELLEKLLTSNGIMTIQIDDNEYAKENDGKAWKYMIIPHTQVKLSNDLSYFTGRYIEN